MRAPRAVAALVVALTAVTAFATVAQAAPNGSGDCTVWQHGVDVSNYQPGIDWSAVPSSGISFAWLKATEGLTFRDSTWDYNRIGASAYGIPWGGYHFARPGRSDGASQARYFVANGGMDGTLPGVLDLEETGGLSSDQLVAWANDFLDTAQQMTGRRPVLYVGAYFLGDYSGLAGNVLWLPGYTAGYTVDPNPCFIRQPYVPAAFAGWDAWQYTSSGRVNGIGGNVDVNVMTPELYAWLTGVGTTPAPVADPVDYAPWTIYRIGSRGPGVSAIQRIVGVTDDGVYGRNTAFAVAAWQSALGLHVDGVWGPATDAATGAFFAAFEAAQAPEEVNPALAFVGACTAQVLRRGDTGACVTLAQQLEAAQGGWVNPDGVFGTITYNVTRSIQASHGLTADGIIGPRTWAALAP